MERPDANEADRYRQLMSEALVELESLHAELDRFRRAAAEPIAVVGLACRFPGGADDPQAFWSLLSQGRDAVTPIPRERWDVDAYYDPDPAAPGKAYCRQAALVDWPLVEGFSPEFFGIAPREAQRMDPQQRMLLEVCWEALEDAAVPPERLRGSRTGLYVGSCTDDYLQWFNSLADPAEIDGYSSLGTARCITVGRVSYLLGLEGPAVQLDTACSSSLVAVHQACAALRSGECEAALAGGVNLQLSPVWTIGLSKLKALAPDGRSKAFDAAADGFGRGEGCGILLLKRLSDALAAGDPIRAVIRGSALNHDGRSSGLTVPSQAAQEKLLRQALAAARLEADQLDAIEAHGTGTALGDPIEMGALGAVFGQRERPLWVGSVKTNIGHLEAAAGVAGLIKLILALEHEAIPPNLHFRRPNPHIPWNELAARVPVELTPWPRGERPRRAGVSSFGFSGTNAHVVVEEAPLAGAPAATRNSCPVLVLSAKSRASLHGLARRYQERLARDPQRPWGDVCYSAAVGRTHFAHRLAVVAESSEQACERLRAVLTDQKAEGAIVDLTGARSEQEADVWPQPADVGRLDARQLAEQAARRYLEGLPIDWEALFRNSACRRIALPTYAFDRQPYWLPREKAVRPRGSDGAASSEPIGSSSAVGAESQPAEELLGRRFETALATGFETQLAADAPGYLGEHCLGATALVPAAALLEMAAAAARATQPEGPVALEAVSFQRPLALPGGESRLVQTLVTPDGDGRRIEIYSRSMTQASAVPPETRSLSHHPLRGTAAFGREGSSAQPRAAVLRSGIGSEVWVRHAAGRATNSSVSSSTVAIEEARRACGEEFSPDAIYERIARQGLRYGPSFRLVRQAWRGPGQALGCIELPENPSLAADDCWFHPALLDACLHVAAALRETDAAGTLVPARLERFELFARPGRQVWSRVRLRAEREPSSVAGFTVDVELADSQGRIVARLVGLHFQPTTAAALLGDEQDSRPVRLAQFQWRPVGQAHTVAPADSGGTWWIVTEDETLGSQIARRLRERGASCKLAAPADVAAALPTGAAHRVVYLAGAELAPDDHGGFAESLRRECAALLRLVQTISGANGDARLWLVTRGSQAVGEAAANPAAVTQSALWGMARVIALEHPQLACRRIDLDPAAAAAGQLDILLGELTHPDAEDQVALRRGERYAARLAELGPPEGAPIIWGEGPVLITGGLGELGLAAAEWLVERGVRRLVLAGRHAAGTSQQHEALARLRRRGAEVEVVQADVAVAADVERLLESIRAAFGPLHGVIHAAGVLDDGLLRDLDETRFERVLAPKLLGAWHLHRLAGVLDFFVLFSSAVGWIGSPGQAAYAAAGAGLDALAQYRRSLGLPAVSVAWGPWELGMTARLGDAVRRRLAESGLRPMASADALSALDRLLAQPAACVAALDADWPRLAGSRPGWPFWWELVPPEENSAPRRAPWLEEIGRTPPGNRMRLLVERIRGEIGAVLGWPSGERVDPKENLFDLGMDSLTSVELQQRLERGFGCSLPLTLAFDCPNVQTLAEYVVRLLGIGLESPSAPLDPQPADDANRVAGMTDEEIQAELMEKYKHLL